MDYSEIKNKAQQKKIKWRVHATQRLMQRNITKADVIEAIVNGEIIEEYPKDFSFPSCLILGQDKNNTSLHIVCS